MVEFVVKSPTKKLKEICKKLGSEYAVRLFDLEQVIYRDFGNGYDLEISGLNNNKKEFNATIFVWHSQESPSVVQKVKNIDSFESLVNVLSEIETKYSNLRNNRDD